MSRGLRTSPCPSDGSLVHFYPQTVSRQLYVQTLGCAEAGQLQAHIVVPAKGACHAHQQGALRPQLPDQV